VSIRTNRELHLALVAGLCGLVCNLLPYTLREGVYLYWGGIFALMAALALGPVEGMLAAVISQMPAQHLEDHWFSLASLVAETALVGYVARRAKKWQHGEGVFWAALLCPLLTMSFYFALPVHPVVAWANMLKCPLESLLGVAGAVLVLTLLGEEGSVGLSFRTLAHPHNPLAIAERNDRRGDHSVRFSHDGASEAGGSAFESTNDAAVGGAFPAGGTGD
jgi:hypothetical protein